MRIPAKRNTPKKNLRPLSLNASCINIGVSLAFVTISLVRGLRKSNVYPFIRQSVVAAHLKPCMRYLRTYTLSETKTKKKLEDDGIERRHLNPWPRGFMTNTVTGKSLPTILATVVPYFRSSANQNGIRLICVTPYLGMRSTQGEVDSKIFDRWCCSMNIVSEMHLLLPTLYT